MNRQVTHDGHGVLQVRFPFDRQLVDLVKTLPDRRWNAAERYWWVPVDHVVELVDLLRERSFRFDEATRQLYRERGGSAILEAAAAPAAASGRSPGLFDGLDGDAADDAADDVAPAAGPPGDFTVAALNERVREVLDVAFPSPVWVVGEIAGFNKSAHRRHVGFELVEHDDAGGTVSKIPATLFEGDRRAIERTLRAAGRPFRLEDEVTVRMLVRVELYVPWGQYRVVVQDLDVHYTLGEAARRREEIIRRLTAAGRIGLNTALPLPALPLRLGLITSIGSDAYNDVLRTLGETGFAFEVTVHGARVQGHATESSVLHALGWFRARADEFDALLICRGGGSRTDLVWFDSEPLGRAVAEFPLPVIVGIGHEQDQSVLDAVARSSKTPTAAATLLVEVVRASALLLDRSLHQTMQAAAKLAARERQLGVERARRLAQAARGLLSHERTRLAHRRERSVLGARAVVTRAAGRLQDWTNRLPRGAALRLTRAAATLDGLMRRLVQGARHELAGARGRIGRAAPALGPAGRRLTARENERLRGRERRLRLLDPRRVLERGYAILRGAGGRVVTRTESAPAGTRLRAELKSGTLELLSEGSAERRAGGD